MQQIRIGRMTPQYLDLLAMKARDFVGHEAAEVEQMNRIRVGRREVRQADRFERRILHAPEHIAPRVVQRMRRFHSAACSHVWKRSSAAARITRHGLVATEFVIGLPRDDRRMPSITRGHRCRQYAGIRADTSRSKYRSDGASRNSSACRRHVPATRPDARRSATSAATRSACRARVSVPAPASVSTASSSHCHSYSPARGSIRLHANSAIRTCVMPSSTIRFASSAHIDRAAIVPGNNTHQVA